MAPFVRFLFLFLQRGGDNGTSENHVRIREVKRCHGGRPGDRPETMIRIYRRRIHRVRVTTYGFCSELSDIELSSLVDGGLIGHVEEMGTGVHQEDELEARSDVGKWWGMTPEKD